VRPTRSALAGYAPRGVLPTRIGNAPSPPRDRTRGTTPARDITGACPRRLLTFDGLVDLQDLSVRRLENKILGRPRSCHWLSRFTRDSHRLRARGRSQIFLRWNPHRCRQLGFVNRLASVLQGSLPDKLGLGHPLHSSGSPEKQGTLRVKPD
jgi:hypothetical protein